MTIAYQIAAETFSELKMPVYYVMGNHDLAVDIQNYLPVGPCEELGKEDGLLTYRFDMGGYRFLTIDARRSGFNFVQLLPSGEMIIHNHTFPQPDY